MLNRVQHDEEEPHRAANAAIAFCRVIVIASRKGGAAIQGPQPPPNRRSRLSLSYGLHPCHKGRLNGPPIRDRAHAQRSRMAPVTSLLKKENSPIFAE